MKKQESLKVTLSLTQGPMSKYYTKKNLRYLEGVNFKDNMYVVQHKVTGKIRIAETFEKNPRNAGFINKII
jgi:calcium-dependent protein kinase